MRNEPTRLPTCTDTMKPKKILQNCSDGSKLLITSFKHKKICCSLQPAYYWFLPYNYCTTVDAILSFIHYVQLAKSEGLITSALFLDVKRVFNHVSSSKLAHTWQKLKLHLTALANISRVFCKWGARCFDCKSSIKAICFSIFKAIRVNNKTIFLWGTNVFELCYCHHVKQQLHIILKWQLYVIPIPNHTTTLTVTCH